MAGTVKVASVPTGALKFILEVGIRPLVVFALFFIGVARIAARLGKARSVAKRP